MTETVPEADLLIADERWIGLDPEKLIARCRRAALAETGEQRLRRQLSVLLTDDEGVRVLNRDYRGKDRPTNVLSFPADPLPGLPEEGQPLGDLAFAYETCAGEATDKGLPIEHHASHLIVHGLLHLVGYDHIGEDEAEAMEALEIRVLARLGIGDPYAEVPGSR